MARKVSTLRSQSNHLTSDSCPADDLCGITMSIEKLFCLSRSQWWQYRLGCYTNRLGMPTGGSARCLLTGLIVRMPPFSHCEI